MFSSPSWLPLPVAVAFMVGPFPVIVGTAASLVVRVARPQLDLRDVFRRTLSWWMVAAALLLLVIVPPAVAVALFAVLIGRALYECVTVARGIGSPLMVTATTLIAVGLGLLGLLLYRGDNDSVVLFVWIFCLTQVNDVAQYLTGKALGRHRVAPRISPRKTVEGLIGGVVITAALSLGLTPALLPVGRATALGFGLVAGLGGFLGDLFFSLVKRRSGVKDFANLLPGQGGILDRLDSVTFTAPVLLCYLAAFAPPVLRT